MSANQHIDGLEYVLAAHQRNENGQHDGWWECDCGKPFTPKHQADMLITEMGFTEEWSDDVAGPNWARYSRVVSKTVCHAGPIRTAAGL